MSKPSNTLAKNFTVLLGSQVVTWALTMLLMVFLPRYLGAVNMGKLHLAISLWTIMGVVMAFGSDQLMVKEIARDSTKISGLFGTKVIFSSVMFCLCMALLIVFLSVFNYPRITQYVVILIGIEFWLWQFVSANEATLQGIEKMEHISIGRIAGHSFNVAISVALLLLGWGIFTIVIVRIIAALVVFAFQFVRLRRITALSPRFESTIVKTLVTSGWPYFLSSVSIVIYMQLDVVIMSFLVSEEAIGWYGTADQLFGTLLFIPTAFITAIYPVYSKLAVNDPDPLKSLMSKSFDSMLLLGVPIGFGLFLVATPLVLLLYGLEFKNSGPVLAAFGIVLVLTYLNMLVGQFLISIDKQKPWALVMTLATVATIPLDLWLIPLTQANFSNGALGGAIAFIITELGMLLCGIALLPANTLGMNNVWSAVRIVASGLVMAGIVWWLQDRFIAVQIVAGALVYIAMILALRVIPKEDISFIMGFGQNIIGRFTHREATAAGQ